MNGESRLIAIERFPLQPPQCWTDEYLSLMNPSEPSLLILPLERCKFFFFFFFFHCLGRNSSPMVPFQALFFLRDDRHENFMTFSQIRRWKIKIFFFFFRKFSFHRLTIKREFSISLNTFRRRARFSYHWLKVWMRNCRRFRYDLIHHQPTILLVAVTAEKMKSY